MANVIPTPADMAFDLELNLQALTCRRLAEWSPQALVDTGVIACRRALHAESRNQELRVENARLRVKLARLSQALREIGGREGW